MDLLVVGGPTHAFSMSRSSTRHDAVSQGAAPQDESTGKRRIGRVVAVESFYVDGVDGPLLEGEVEPARDWARSLVRAGRPV